MIQKKDWKKPFAIILFITLLGGYYDQLSFETRTMVLPIVIIIAVAFVISRLKQLEYETRSAQVFAHKITTQAFSVLDRDGKERVAISADTEKTALTFYDKNHTPCATLELADNQPALKLAGNKGIVLIAFDNEGRPNLSLKGAADETIWSAP
ncbi:MAG: hypothetical protein ABIK98_12945 [Pseudomonadota bacterium]|uniref:Uncharacterized protein n=1 Tax=Candidatus Desulfatibia profunda TaxID=2841695 RepID=A0A8J6NRL1_9BACT|nr:hypothetical protein [Candidatus Desulfatibia profunda]MBL7179183.1 hypothetical protein [Desulfobacterales bacterium]MBU0698205.1 hypothetical protein [Pseudomonadota bacterium]